MFLDDDTARKWFEKCRWPGGIVYCYACGLINIQHGPKHPTMTQRFRDFKKFFFVKSGMATLGFTESAAAKDAVVNTDDQNSFHGAYQKLSRKHLARCVLEFEGRHILTPLDTKEQMRQIANDLSGRRLRYKDLVA